MRKINWKKLLAVAKSLQNGSSISAACEGAKMSRATLWYWRKDEKVNALIQKLIDSQIQIVEDALFKRAIGYRYEEETKEREISASDKKVVKVTTKEVAPDVTAQIFFLTNRAPERWRDRRALVNNTILNRVDNNNRTSLSDEELRRLIRLGEAIN